MSRVAESYILVKRPTTPYYYVQVRQIDGKIKRISTKKTTKREAREVAEIMLRKGDVMTLLSSTFDHS